MSDHLTNSPMVAISYCPTCESRDPLAEALDVRYCYRHEPTRTGADDDAVIAVTWVSGTTEAGGEDNAAFCNLLHRKVLLRAQR